MRFPHFKKHTVPGNMSVRHRNRVCVIKSEINKNRLKAYKGRCQNKYDDHTWFYIFF